MANAKSTQTKAPEKVAKKEVKQPKAVSARGFSFNQELVLTTIQTTGVVLAAVLGLVATCKGAKSAAMTAQVQLTTLQEMKNLNNKEVKTNDINKA